MENDTPVQAQEGSVIPPSTGGQTWTHTSVKKEQKFRLLGNPTVSIVVDGLCGGRDPGACHHVDYSPDLEIVYEGFGYDFATFDFESPCGWE